MKALLDHYSYEQLTEAAPKHMRDLWDKTKLPMPKRIVELKSYMAGYAKRIEKQKQLAERRRAK